MSHSRVLIIDDDRKISRLIQQRLLQLGIQSLVLWGAQDLHSVLERERPEVLLLDLAMPQVDGIQALKLIAQHANPPRVALMSGRLPAVLESAVRVGQSLGLDMLPPLSKPAGVQRLLDQPLDTLGIIDVDRITRAIRESELHNAYQPIVSADDGKLVGLEALVRWQHPVAGSIPPPRIVSAAQVGNCFTELTDSVLRRAVTEGAGIVAEHGLPTPHMHVNISPSSLQDHELPARVEAICADAGFPLENLTLEVTEDLHFGGVADSALEVATRLRLRQVGLAVDDFGAGYASLTALLSLPFTEVKLDRSLVQAVLRAPRGQSMHDIVSMLHQLGMSVVAEGVETEAALQRLRAAGCDTIQGFHICGPLSPTALSGWLEDRYVDAPMPIVGRPLPVAVARFPHATAS